MPDGREEWIFSVTSGLASLSQQSRYRIVHQRSVIELAEALLKEHGLTVDNRTRQSYLVMDWTTQVGETDLQFLQRQLARHGIWCYSRKGDQGEIIVLADDQHGAERADRGQLDVMAEVGGNRSAQGMASVALRQSHRYYRWQPEKTRIHQQVCPSEFPAQTQDCRFGNTESAAEQVFFEAGSPDAHDAISLARLETERQQCRAHVIRVSGAIGDLQPGQWVPIEGEGPCLVTEARLTFSSPRNHQGNTPTGFVWEAELLHLSQAYRPALPEKVAPPLVFPARVESSGPYSELDGQCRRVARLHFDDAGKPHAESSPPLRQLQPHGSLPGLDGQSTGWDWPLRDGAEVLLTCLNNDPDQPVILGYAPAANQPGPVINQNASENRLLTPAGNQLSLDDRKNAQAITLNTPDGECLLVLDAASDSPIVTLACEQGALVMRAGGSQSLEVGKSSQTRVGSDSTTQVMNHSSVKTDSGLIHYQSQTDTHATAKNNATLEAKNNLELYSAANSQLRIEGNLSITAPKGLATRIGGSLHLQAADAIDIRGDGSGDITLHQGGGGITIKTDGTIRLFGNTVTLKSQSGVTFNGNMEYGVPVPVVADSPVPATLNPVSPIPEMDLPRMRPEEVKTLSVMPLRHGVIASRSSGALQAVPALPAHLSEPFRLAKAKSTVETLREGYLSVLIEQEGVRRWQHYRSLPNGHLEHRGSAPRPPYRASATIPTRSSVVLDEPNTITNTWWLFSPDPLTEAKCQEYQANADEYASEGKWQAFTPQVWLQGQRNVAGTLSGKQLRRHLLEAQLESSLELQQTLAEQPFAPPWLNTGPGTVWDTATFSTGVTQLEQTLNDLQKNSGVSLVLNDALGIAQTLNNWRNGALDRSKVWLEEKDAQGVNNDWKVQIQQQIAQLHQGYAGRKAAKFIDREERTWSTRTKSALAALEYEEQYKRKLYGDERFEVMYGEEFSRRKADIMRQEDGWLAHQSIQQYSPEQQAIYQREFEQDYLSRLDTAKMDQVKSAFQQQMRDAEQEMDRRAEDQIAVLRSEQLQNALHAYDKDNMQSGARFTTTLGKAIDGLIGCQAGRDIMDSWWSEGPQGDPENLCWRALAYNQQALEDNLIQLAIVLLEQVGDSNDWAAIGSIQLVQAATGHFEKLDGAIGSLESHGVAVSGALAWQAGLLRKLFGSGHPTKGETALYRLLGTVSRAQLGSYAFDARMNELLASGSNANPNRVRGQLNRYSGKSLEDFITQPKTSEVRYGRALSVLIVLEAVMLLVKAETTEDKGSRFYLEAMAGVMAGAACGAELLASAAEAAAKRGGSATAHGARILQGNRKLWAASLGTVGGVVLAAYDLGDGAEAYGRNEIGLSAVYFARGFAGLALSGSGSLLAIAAARPFFEHVAKTSSHKAAAEFAKLFATASIRLGAEGAQKLLTRLLIGSNVVFWGVTGIWYLVAPDALESWCDESVFRDNDADGYADMVTELSELWMAVGEVI